MNCITISRATAAVLLASVALLAVQHVAAAPATISYLQCMNCLTNATADAGSAPVCGQSSFVEGACSPMPAGVSREFAGKYQKVSCDATPSTCATFMFSLDGTQCSTLHGTFTVQCGGCNYWGGGQYAKLVCGSDPSSQLSAQWANCTDSTCSSCSNYPTTYTLDNCQMTYVNDAGQNVYSRLQTIAGCVAVQVGIYTSSACTPASLYQSQPQGQGSCSGVGRYVCSSAPPVPAPTGPQVLVTDYEGHSRCIGPASFASVSSGACRMRSMTLSENVTCTGTRGYCADLMVYGLRRTGRRIEYGLDSDPLCTRHQSSPAVNGCACAGVTADSVAMRVWPTR